MEAHTPESVHRLIAGRYELVSALGSGRRGAVYLARDRALQNHDVALKLLLNVPSGDEQALKSLRQEVLSSRRIKSPYIVQVFEFALAGAARPFIVLEYVSGGTLRELMCSPVFDSLPFAERLRMFRETCLAIETAHTGGVVHRDIKPENILLTSSRAVKVTDFGFARLLDTEYSISRSEETIGTPLYMAPEQFQGRRGDARSDIYSLGILAFELFSGQLPYSGESFLELAIAHVKEPLPLDELQRNGAPLWLQGLIRRSAEKNRDDRYGSVREMLDEIETHTPPELIEASLQQGGELRRLQVEEKRRRRNVRIRRALRLWTRYGMPLTIGTLIVLCRVHDRSAGDAARVIFAAEKYLRLDLSPVARLFSVPWSYYRPQEIFEMIDESGRRADARKALSSLGSLGAAENVYNSSGETPLTYAAIHSDNDALQTLLESGVSPTGRNKSGETPLVAAFRSGNTQTISAIARLLPFQACDELGNNALELAYLREQIGLLVTLTVNNHSEESSEDADRARAILDYGNKRGRTVLHLVALRPPPPSQETYIVPLLLLHGANRNIQDDDGMTALMYSIEAGRLKMASELLLSGEDLRRRFEQSQFLRTDIGYPMEPVLLDPNVQDPRGRTALMMLVEANNASACSRVDYSSVLEQLLKYGPDLERSDNAGDTALAYAVRNGSPELVHRLILQGANYSSVNRRGEPAFMVADASGRRELAALLRATAQRMSTEASEASSRRE